MKGALPSQWDGGWQQAQLGGTTPSSACAGSRGCQGDLEAGLAPSSPGQTQESAKGLVPTQHPESFPPQTNPRKGQRRAWLNTREQGCTCMTTHTSAVNTLLL